MEKLGPISSQIDAGKRFADLTFIQSRQPFSKKLRPKRLWKTSDIWRECEKNKTISDYLVHNSRELLENYAPLMVLNTLTLDREQVAETCCFVHALSRERVGYAYGILVPEDTDLTLIFHASEYLPVSRVFLYFTGESASDNIKSFVHQYVHHRYTTTMYVPFTLTSLYVDEKQAVRDYRQMGEAFGIEIDYEKSIQESIRIFLSEIRETPKHLLSPAAFIISEQVLLSRLQY